MNRLTYRGKLAVIGALALGAAAFASISLALDKWQEAERVRHELGVVEALAPLQKLIRVLQQHRGMSSAVLSGEAAMAPQLDAKRAEVDAAIVAIVHFDNPHSPLIDTTSEWRAIRREWESLRTANPGLTAAVSLDLHNQLIERMLRFQVTLADAGGLTLDNRLDTYYLGETLYRSLPEMLEQLGKMRAKGTGVLVKRHIEFDDRVELSIYIGRISYHLKALNIGLDKVSYHAPSASYNLGRFSARLGESVDLAIRLVETDIFSAKFQTSPGRFFDQLTQAIDIGYKETFDTLFPTIEQRLLARKAELERQLALGIGLASLFLLALAYLLSGAYLAVVESVRRLTDGAATIAAGDLSARVRLEGRDELAVVADSFNLMAGALDRLIRESKQRSAELSEALEAARQADRTKDAFLANMSHELRTPLNAVIGMTRLAHDASTDPRLRDQLGKVMTAGRHLNRIIDDLLDLSKIAAGHMEIEAISFSLESLAHRLQSLMHHRAEEKGLRFSLVIDQEVPDILRGDPLRIEQILLNLLGNAIKFTAAGSITLRFSILDKHDGHFRLEAAVEDTGVGIPERELERLFQPFTQVDASVSRRFGGTGLGLAISKQLAALMGGDISVSSREGVGTCFRVVLPLEPGDPGELDVAASIGNADLPCHYRDTRVLVAEDQPVNREIVEALLDSVGIRARMVENGHEALMALDIEPAGFDLVLMDVQMPVLDGLAATRAIRQDPRFVHLPIIGMTAHTMEHERRQCKEAGMNDHIGKPFDNLHFFHALAKWIPESKQHVEPDEAPAMPVADRAPGSGNNLRELREVDVDAGLARFNGKEERYRHWLLEIATHAPANCHAILQEVDAGNLEVAARLAHGLKGRSGMLGLNQLHAASAELEAALRSGVADQAKMHTFENVVSQTAAEISRVLA